MVTIGVVSGFINNTAAVAIFIPVVIDMARAMNMSPSRLLIPLSFASMLGGVTTLIGTSTNLIVDSIAVEHGLDGFGMFEFTPVGIALFVVGIAYLLLAHGRIPERRPPDDEDLTDRFEIGSYLVRIELVERPSGTGPPLDRDDLKEDFDIEVVDIERSGEVTAGIDPDVGLAEGDIVRVQGNTEALRRIAETDGVRLVEATGQRKLDDAIETPDEALVEAVLAPDSPLAGLTVDDLDLGQRHGAQAIGLRQAGSLKHRLPEVRLHGGDTLLLKIDRDRLRNLRQDEDFIVVSEVEADAPRTGRMPAAIAIVVAVVAAAASGAVPIVAAAVAGALGMVAVGALHGEEAYESINWTVILLLAGVLPLGTALEDTGGAALVADAIVDNLAWLGPTAVLAGFLVATTLLTSVISNNASAVLFAPIAISAAETLGVSPRPLLVAVTVAASTSFLTPIGYQTNTMVYGPGQYRFTDFTKVGGPLNLVVLLVAVAVIPLVFPF
jgi:di/tricarboxylate transporter